MKKLDVIAAALLMVGGLNWGLVGLFKLDLVQAIFSGWASALATVVYIVVGLAALYQVTGWKAIQRRWQQMEIPVQQVPSVARVKS